VTSSSGEDGSAIANPETLALASSLLQLDKDLMNRALTFRNVGTKSAVLVNYTIAQAAQARDVSCTRAAGP
jgi:myosin heavy subunit